MNICILPPCTQPSLRSVCPLNRPNNLMCSISWESISYDEEQNCTYSWLASQKQFLLELLSWHFQYIPLFSTPSVKAFVLPFLYSVALYFLFAFSPSAPSPSHIKIQPLPLEIQALPGKYPVSASRPQTCGCTCSVSACYVCVNVFLFAWLIESYWPINQYIQAGSMHLICFLLLLVRVWWY